MQYRRVYRDTSGIVVDERVWVIDYETVQRLYQEHQQRTRQRSWLDKLFDVLEGLLK